MKTFIKITTVVLSLLSFYACDVNDTYDVDVTPPNPPTGIQVINGDNRVDLIWNENRESDIAGYNIYFSYSFYGQYELIGSSAYADFVDYDAVNGETYYYAVTAYDYNGNESELSFDVIYSTPRPEGFNQAIFDYLNFPNNSGYEFATYSIVSYDDDYVDFFFENFEGDFYLNVYDDTDIQDMGPTNDIYDIPYAPTSGWSQDPYVPAIVGHTYVIWTWDNHFAKIRISQITNERMVFDWTYQTVEGEHQLKMKVKPEKRNPLQREWGR
jgi:hypothetical protein